MIYCYPVFSRLDFFYFRIGGPGLGNLLFPWARAIILSERYGFKMISPNWPQLKVGPILRFELDVRNYFNIFKNSFDNLNGLKRLIVLAINPRISEFSLGDIQLRSGDVVTTEGMGQMFADFLPFHALIKSKLQSIVNSHKIDNLISDLASKNSIAVHIRFGDFKKSNDLSSVNTRQPIEWYVDSILAIRRKLNNDIRVNVFSDASEVEIADVLALPSTFRIMGNNAIEDILLISNHKVLIASGSTFSMWGSFLGQIPTIWFPGKKTQNLLQNKGLEVEYKQGSELVLDI